MPKSSKYRLSHLLDRRPSRPGTLRGSMRGTAKVLGEIVRPVRNDCPWDAELGIAYHGENGPVYWVRGELSEIDDR